MPKTSAPRYCFRTFGSQAEAIEVMSRLTDEFGSRLTEPVTMGLSDFTGMWCLYCHQGDSRALYIMHLHEVLTDRYWPPGTLLTQAGYSRLRVVSNCMRYGGRF